MCLSVCSRLLLLEIKDDFTVREDLYILFYYIWANIIIIIIWITGELRNISLNNHESCPTLRCHNRSLLSAVQLRTHCRTGNRLCWHRLSLKPTRTFYYSLFQRISLQLSTTLSIIPTISSKELSMSASSVIILAWLWLIAFNTSKPSNKSFLSKSWSLK